MNKIFEVVKNIKKPDYAVASKTQEVLDNLTKPKGSLGELEEIAKKVAVITGIVKPKIAKKFVFVLAADHGIAEENVSLYPQEVTKQMVYNFLAGGAAINVFAKYTNSEIFVVDTGVKHKFDFGKEIPLNFVDKKINFGTKNFLKENAMSYDEAVKSVISGIEIIESLISKFEKKNDEVFLVTVGDMGIGNTTTASVITAIITGAVVEDVVGRGTGITDEMYKNKVEVVKKTLQKYKFDLNNPLDVISKVGGFEIATAVGMFLACAMYRIPIVLDGFITTSAALIASCFSCSVIDYMFAGHLSYEKGHKVQLEFLGLKPILNLNMRLGEGTGGCLAMCIIELACKVLNEMSTFDHAGVSREIKI